MALVGAVVAVALVAMLPGTLLFRLPVADRARRAALSAEERIYWSVVLSAAVSSIVVLSLAAGGWYRFDRLLWTNGSLSLAIVLLARGRLRYGPIAPRPGWTAALPVALLVVAWVMVFAVPPAEYVMGGKDPGVYMNEGVQIAQRGSLALTDPTVARVPVSFRDLFFPDRGEAAYYSNRFMGFFLMDPSSGRVLSQFTHLYPAWIAIAYGVHGLSGAREVLGLWAILGVVSVYFLGNRLAGRWAGAAGAALLAVHVLQVWYARYPNAEMVMQPLVFAGLLAYVRGQTDGDRFFAVMAGVLFALCVFAHLTGVFVVAGVVATIVVARVGGDRPSPWLVAPLLVGGILAVVYLTTLLGPYVAVPVGFLRRPYLSQRLGFVAAFTALALLWWAGGRPEINRRVRTWLPTAFVSALCLLAAYAWFLRVAGGRLPPHDADALRTFASFYVTPLGLVAAVAGLVLLVRRSFWTSAPFLIVFAAFSVFFFYKLRIIPEHFWAGRRFVAVILPGTLLLAGAAAFGQFPLRGTGPLAWVGGRAAQAARRVVGLLLILTIGYQYVGATGPVLRHVEYAGLIPRLEQLASTAGDDDLVVFEARAASDVHVLALPLAYIYARNVLVLWESAPDKRLFREFLGWARGNYRRIFFVGGGGTELLSRSMGVRALGGERFQIPEYESIWHAYPRTVRFKEFDFGVYEFLPVPVQADGFDLDVGVADDLYVRRFHAKERRPSGTTFRWTQQESFVSVVGTRADCRQLTIWMGAGGRPPGAEVAGVEVFLDDVPLGAVTTGEAFSPFSFDVPPELAARIAAAEEAAQLRLVSRTWNPSRLIGANDNRDLGVMVDRMTLACPESPGG
jgi:hypothetical protein